MSIEICADEPASDTHARRRLPNRRASFSTELAHDGAKYHVQFGARPDGRVGEVFVDGHKTGSSLDALASDGAILVSLLLQLGVAPREIAHALRRNSRGDPATIIGRVLDELVAQHDLHHYPTPADAGSSN